MSWIKKTKNLTIRLSLSLIASLFFFLVAEVCVRTLYPELTPSTKYDWSSRNEGYSLEKLQNSYRIIVLGDSFTFGQGVGRAETFPKRLEERLNNLRGIRFEVINLGYCGLNTTIEKMILEDRGVNPKTWESDKNFSHSGSVPLTAILTPMHMSLRQRQYLNI